MGTKPYNSSILDVKKCLITCLLYRRMYNTPYGIVYHSVPWNGVWWGTTCLFFESTRKLTSTIHSMTLPLLASSSAPYISCCHCMLA